METTTRAQRMAGHGARKMIGAGYSFEAAALEGWFWVKKPLQEGESRRAEYFVSPAEALCSCPFAKAEGICKHQVWLQEQLDWEASIEAREAQMQEA